MKRTPIRARSKKRAYQMRTHRVPTIQAMIEAGRKCEVCPLLAAQGVSTRCAGRIEGLHELRKSSAAGSRLNPANTVPSCNNGNGLVELFPVEAHAAGLVLREGDEGWDEMSSRFDRFL